MIELVTTLLSQDKVSPEQAASILQQMLPPSALSHLQLHLNTPRSSLEAEGMAPRPQAYRCARAQAGRQAASSGLRGLGWAGLGCGAGRRLLGLVHLQRVLRTFPAGLTRHPHPSPPPSAPAATRWGTVARAPASWATAPAASTRRRAPRT